MKPDLKWDWALEPNLKGRGQHFLLATPRTFTNYTGLWSLRS